MRGRQGDDDGGDDDDNLDDDDDEDARPSLNCDRSRSFDAAQARQARREGLERFERGV